MRSDSDIKQDVEEELRYDPDIYASDITAPRAELSPSGFACVGRCENATRRSFWRSLSRKGHIMIARFSARALSPRLMGGCCLAASILLMPAGSTLGQSSPQSAPQPKAGVDITRQAQSTAAIPLPSLSPLVERVAPAVVNVSVVMSDQEVAAEGSDDGPGNQATPFDEFLRRFFEQQGLPDSQQHRRPQPRAGRAMALGSGFIIDQEGDIVTNNHV